MDRNLYFQNLANEHQGEISKEMQRKQIELRVAQFLIGFSALMLIFFR